MTPSSHHPQPPAGWTFTIVLAVTALLVPSLAAAVGGDTCASATILPWATFVTAGGFSDCATTGTNDDGGVTCGSDGSDVFFAFTAARTANMTFTTCSTIPLTGDTILSLHRGASSCTTPAVDCNDDSACAGGPLAVQSTLDCIPVTAGTQYFIQVDNKGSSTSIPFCLRVVVLPWRLTESTSPLPGTGTVIFDATFETYLHTPAPDPLLFYNASGCSVDPLLLAVKRGGDVQFYFR